VVQPARVIQAASLQQISQGRSTCHGGHASLRFVANLDQPAILNLGRETQYIAANGILNLGGRIRLLQFASMPPVLKIPEQLRRIHGPIV
jgi:hypothetical protein